jgi:hypothetical protein
MGKGERGSGGEEVRTEDRMKAEHILIFIKFQPDGPIAYTALGWVKDGIFLSK